LLTKIQAERGYEPRKLRELHFDVLIALTARTHGTKLITSNRGDFELIRKYRDLIWRSGSHLRPLRWGQHLA
jgi:predicted nucleic acid-binding protein